MIKFSRRGFLRAGISAAAGVVASGVAGFLPFFAPSPEKKLEEESEINIIDAKNMVFYDGVKDPDDSPSPITEDGYREKDIKKALDLVREIDSDNQTMLMAGGAAGSAVSAILSEATDAVLSDETQENLLSNPDIANIGVSTVGVAALSDAVRAWSERKLKVQIAPTRSASYLSTKYGMPQKSAEAFSRHEKFTSCVSSFAGAVIGSTVSRLANRIFHGIRSAEENKPEQVIEPE